MFPAREIFRSRRSNMRSNMLNHDCIESVLQCTLNVGPHVHWTHLRVYAQEWYARENFRELLVRNLSELVQAAM